MIILLLEDRGSVAFYLKLALEKEGHAVLEAMTVNDADEYLDQAECLIVDLNMSANGLEESEVVQTKEGLLTGWVWLQTHAFAERPELRERTIILTEYMSSLRQYVDPLVLEGICLVHKRRSQSPVAEVLKHVRRFSLRYEGTAR